MIDKASTTNGGFDPVNGYDYGQLISKTYYAADADKSGKTNYLHTISKTFINGRKLITDAHGKKLSRAQRTRLKRYAEVIKDNWEKIIAEAAFKYAGSVYKDIKKMQVIIESNGEIKPAYRAYVKHCCSSFTEFIIPLLN